MSIYDFTESAELDYLYWTKKLRELRRMDEYQDERLDEGQDAIAVHFAKRCGVDFDAEEGAPYLWNPPLHEVASRETGILEAAIKRCQSCEDLWRLREEYSTTEVGKLLWIRAGLVEESRQWVADFFDTVIAAAVACNITTVDGALRVAAEVSGGQELLEAAIMRREQELHAQKLRAQKLHARNGSTSIIGIYIDKA